MAENFEYILKKIEKYTNISLFFHERPDFDTLGSCFALKEFIGDNYPNKTVKIVGLDTLPDLYASSLFYFDRDANYATDEFISSSLGIVSDAANNARVYSRKNSLCKETIRVDHHPLLETFCDFEWIDPMTSSACEMWADLFFKSGKIISSNCAKYLYAGIITDTNRFLSGTTSPLTYLMVSKLTACGFNRNEVHDSIYLQDERQIYFTTYLMRRLKVLNKIAYFTIPKGTHKKFNIYPQYSMVDLLSKIKNVDVWTTLYFDEQTQNWKGSMRSRRVQINHIAAEFGGGGHKFAAAFTLTAEKDFEKVVQRLDQYLNSLKL